MRRWLHLIIGLVGAVFPLIAAAQPASLALVIGNSLYAGMPALPACAASANVVSAALKRAGFAVTTGLNLSNGRMGAAIADFGDAIARDPGGVALAYVCGYAVGFDGRAFLMPTSANLERDTDTLTQGLVARVLVNTVVNSDAKAGLVLLDSAAQPGRSAPIPLDASVNPAALGGKGFVSVYSNAPLPEGATPLAAATVAGIAAPEIETQELLASIGAAVKGLSGVTTVINAPTGPSWLKGGPAPPTQSAAPVAAATAAQQPAVPPPPVPSPAATFAATSTRSGEIAVLSEADRRRIQLSLQRLGYYNGRVDGIAGADTLAAIRRYQHELNAEMTGRLTSEQSDRLLLDSR